MYLADIYHRTVIPKTITKETDHFVWVQSTWSDGAMTAKKSQGHRYFDTELEGWQWIAEHYRNEHNTLIRRADQALFAIVKIQEQIKKLNQ